VVWIFASLGNAITFTIVNIIDSHIISKKMPSLSSFLVMVGIIQLIIASVLLAVFTFPVNTGVMHYLVAIGAGLLNAVSLIILFNCLRKGEVSRVVPVVCSSPIFVALLSMPLLRETLNFWEWLAILLAVIGTVLISLQRDEGAAKTRLQKSFILLLLAAVLAALSSIGYKYALGTLSFWNMASINGICAAAVILPLSLRKSTLLELKNLKQRTQILGLIISNQILAAAGTALGFVAFAFGPVALVSTITNIRPVFIFLFSLVISRFYPNFINERLNKRAILIKFIGIVMITVGVAIISLTSKS
jgi:drug/metabolite transporter (DMT)-like permease